MFSGTAVTAGRKGARGQSLVTGRHRAGRCILTGADLSIDAGGAADDTLICQHQGTSAPKPGNVMRLTVAEQSIVTLGPSTASA